MTIANVFPILLIAALFTFFIYYWRSMLPRPGTLEWIPMRTRTPLRFRRRRYPMQGKDALPLLLITLLYAVTAFFRLGSMQAPQSFARFTAEPVVVELSQRMELSRLDCYAGLNIGSYTVSASLSGENWVEVGTINQGNTDLFKWRAYDLGGGFIRARYLRIAPNPSMGWTELGELALYTAEGERVSVADMTLTDDTRPLFDEQDAVPDEMSWYNSSYFDEIYYNRTALQHLRGLAPYETTHPPLGKLIIATGMALFGTTPFGWRFMGTLFGVLMLPLLYIFLKNLFGKTSVAAIGTTLFAVNFMHLAQTRLATLDSFVVFFILAAYFFFYRYLTAKRLRSGILPLLLSGLAFGLGVAVKWPVLYAGAGLAVLWLVHLILRRARWKPRIDGNFFVYLTLTVLLSVLFFVAIPAAIYLASYIPNTAANGDVTLINLWNTMWDNQLFMFGFHSGVRDAHPYSSSWYQWIVNARPILYYRNDSPALREAGLRTLFSAFDNPVLSWGGLLCIIATGIRAFSRKSATALFILIGYLAQLVPWCFVPRTTFAYHYFPATIFLTLAMCFVFNDLLDRRPPGYRWPVYGLPCTAVLLYAVFYPALIGLTVPIWYNEWFIKWLPSWAM